jgi:hypothetical protein
VHTEDLIAFLEYKGFSRIDVIETRNERNGPRICLIANR